jgi:hypothetical protein
MDDYEKDEKELIKDLRRDFRVVFRITYEELDEIMANFDGTTHELYLYVKDLMKKRREAEYSQVSK